MALWLHAKVRERGLGLRLKLNAGPVCDAQRCWGDKSSEPYSLENLGYKPAATVCGCTPGGTRRQSTCGKAKGAKAIEADVMS